MRRLVVILSSLIDIDLSHNLDSSIPGDATNKVKNVVTMADGLWSGSLNLCLISGFNPCETKVKVDNVKIIIAAVLLKYNILGKNIITLIKLVL